MEAQRGEVQRDARGRIVGFQLCFDKDRHERALTTEAPQHLEPVTVGTGPLTIDEVVAKAEKLAQDA